MRISNEEYDDNTGFYCVAEKRKNNDTMLINDSRRSMSVIPSQSSPDSWSSDSNSHKESISPIGVVTSERMNQAPVVYNVQNCDRWSGALDGYMDGFPLLVSTLHQDAELGLYTNNSNSSYEASPKPLPAMSNAVTHSLNHHNQYHLFSPTIACNGVPQLIKQNCGGKWLETTEQGFYVPSHNPSDLGVYGSPLEEVSNNHRNSVTNSPDHFSHCIDRTLEWSMDASTADDTEVQLSYNTDDGVLNSYQNWSNPMISSPDVPPPQPPSVETPNVKNNVGCHTGNSRGGVNLNGAPPPPFIPSHRQHPSFSNNLSSSYYYFQNYSGTGSCGRSPSLLNPYSNDGTPSYPEPIIGAHCDYSRCQEPSHTNTLRPLGVPHYPQQAAGQIIPSYDEVLQANHTYSTNHHSWGLDLKSSYGGYGSNMGLGMAENLAVMNDARQDPQRVLNEIWVSVARFKHQRPNHSQLMMFNHCVIEMIRKGQSAVRILTQCTAFSRDTPNYRFANGIECLELNVRKLLEEAVLHDITYYLCDKKAMRCLTYMTKRDPEFANQVIGRIRDNFAMIVKDKQGSLTIQKILFDCKLDIGTLQMLSEILIKHCYELVENPYGNYVLTKFMELPGSDRIRKYNSRPKHVEGEIKSVIKDFIRAIATELIANIERYCNSKYASPVLESIIKHGDDNVRERIELHLLLGGTSSVRVERYMELLYANYVVQTCCDYCTDPVRKRLLVEGIRRAAVCNDLSSERSGNREAYRAKMLRKYNVSVDEQSDYDRRSI